MAFKYIYVLIDAWLIVAYIEYASALIYDELKKVSWYDFSDFVTVRSLTDDHNFFKGKLSGGLNWWLKIHLFQRFCRDFPNDSQIKVARSIILERIHEKIKVLIKSLMTKHKKLRSYHCPVTFHFSMKLVDCHPSVQLLSFFHPDDKQVIPYSRKFYPRQILHCSL